MPIAALGGRTLHSVCLSVEQDYGDPAVPADFQLPIAEMAARLIRASGVQVFDEANACEATLFIGLTGRPVGAGYINLGGCLTGAEYEGRIVLTSTNGESVAVPAEGREEPPGAITGCRGGIEDTPFGLAAARALLDGLASIWGPRVLVSSLGQGSPDFPVFRVAQEELLATGDDAIPLLIEGLSHGDPGTRKDSALVLCEFGPRASPAVPALIHNLDDEHQGPPKSVQTSPPGVVPVRWKHFPWRDVRMAAVEALRDIGPDASEAVSSLIQILEEEDSARNRPAIREIVWALEGITGQELGEDPAAWKEFWERS